MFDTFTRREKWVLLLGALFCVAGILYSLKWLRDQERPHQNTPPVRVGRDGRYH